MKKHTLILAACSAIFWASCQNGNNPNLAGKWQATSIESPTRDSMLKEEIKQQMAHFDTLSKVDSSLIKHFGTTNIDTIKIKAREEISKQGDEMKKQMSEGAKDICFEFLSSGKIVEHQKEGNDTAEYYFADNGKKLVLDPYGVKDANPMRPAQLVVFDIIHTGSDSLRLRVHQPVGNDVFINFRPAKADEGAKDSKDSTKK
jgi:hypothetical protein